MLREAREAQKFSFADVEKGTKIREKFLRAIEADEFSSLPSVSYAKGFVKNYSEFLGLQSETMLAFFRRQSKEVTRAVVLPKSEDATLNRSIFQLTPGKFIAAIIVSLVALFLSYLGYQYHEYVRPPLLVVEKPEQGSLVEGNRIEVFGKTDTDATVTINDVGTIVRSDGKFFDQVALDSGVNAITVVATSRFGKTTTITREVGLTVK